MPVTVLHVGYAEVIFIQPRGKLDTMWRDAWHRLASSYPTSRWDVAVNLMVTAAERCSLSHRQKHRNLQRENLQYFVHRIARIWTRLLAIWGVFQQMVYHHQSFSSVDKIKRAIVKSMAETTVWRSHCQFITFITFLFTVNVIRQMAPLFSKVDSNKLRRDVQHEENVISAKFGKDLSVCC